MSAPRDELGRVGRLLRHKAQRGAGTARKKPSPQQREGLAALHDAGWHHQEDGENPRDGVDVHQVVEARPPRHDGQNPYQAEDARAEDGDEGRLQRVAHAAHGRCRNLIACRHPLEPEHDEDARVAVADHVGGGGEKTHEEVGTRDEDQVARQAGQRAAREADPKHALAALSLSRAIVLADEGHGRAAESHEQKITVGIKHLADACPGDGRRAVGVDAALHEDVAQREHHTLQSGRNADFQNASGRGPVEPDVARAQPHRRLLVHENPYDEACREGVGDAGGDGHARHAHVEHDDEEEIKQRVDETGYDEDVERALRVAHAAQDGGAEVVGHEEWGPGEIDAQVEHGVVDDVGRRAHELQHGPCDGHAAGEQHEAADNGQHGRGAHGTLYAAFVALPDEVGDDHVGPHRDAHEEIDGEVDEERVGPHGGQSLAGGEAPHDDEVDRIE